MDAVSVGATIMTGADVSEGKMTGVDVSLGKDVVVLVINGIGDAVDIEVGGMRDSSQLVRGWKPSNAPITVAAAPMIATRSDEVRRLFLLGFLPLVVSLGLVRALFLAHLLGVSASGLTPVLFTSCVLKEFSFLSMVSS